MKKLLSILFFSILCQAQEIPVAVIGSGPAGLSSALVTARDRIETHVFEGPRLGGPANAITCLGNWPASVHGKGDVVMNRLLEQIEKLSVQMHRTSIVECDFSTYPYLLKTDSGEEYYAKAVILAMGAISRKLNVPGEEKYLGKQIETSLYKNDTPRFQGKTVAVVGGGIDAVKKACILAKTASEVHLIVRGPSIQKPYFAQKIAKKGKGKMKVHTQSEVTEIVGNDQAISYLVVQSPKHSQNLRVDALILAIGIEPNTRLIKGQVACNEQGYILLKGRTQKTNLPGIFAAGTVTDSQYRQAAISAGDGMKAGYDALRFLTHQ